MTGKFPPTGGLRAKLAVVGLTSLLGGLLVAQESQLTELEEFIAEETALADSDSLLPTDRLVDSAFFGNMSVMELPRAVTVISPETMKQYQVDDVYDLPNLVPGSSVTNYYGVPGIPTTRGLFTSVYFNGMQRVWNRNGYPTSFGSLEAMDYAKGPPPGTFSAASPGGYVNFIPKSPYFDETSGSLKLTIGKWDRYRAQFDVGGPMVIGKTPAAFRLSVTSQDSDTFYDGIKDDYTSIYAALKVRLSDDWRIFVGGEFYRHRSNENPGWNRVTQDLIDHQQYIVGQQPVDLTEDSFTITYGGTDYTFENTTPGFVNRAALESATPFGGTRGNFDLSFRALSGFADSGFRPGNFGPEEVAVYRALGGIDNPGSGVTTEFLPASTVVTSPSDFADADTYLFFFDTIFEPSDRWKFTNKLFIDAYTREKTSDYGYGELGENFTIENKLVVEQKIDWFEETQISYGADVRYEDALAKTEFTVEPFGRRDLTKGATQNDRLFSGGQRDENGKNFWDPFGSWDTQRWNFGLFGVGNFKFGGGFSILGSARIDHSTWDRAVPFDVGADFNSGEKAGGGITYTNFSVSPTWRINQNATIYYTYQIGTSYQGFYVSGGVSSGDTNFQESSLHEFGIRTSHNEGRVFTSTSLFYQDLVNFDTRGGSAVPQRGKGVEFEGVVQVVEDLTIRANLTWQEHHYRSATVPGGFVPLTPEQLVDFTGIFYADFGGRPNPGGPRFGIPEWIGSLYFVYQAPLGFGISGGPTYRDGMYANPDKTLTIPSYTELSGSIFYKAENWEIQLSGKNLTSADIYQPFDAFAANSNIKKEPPASWEVNFTYKF